MCSICVLWTDQFILKVLGTTDVRRWMIIQTVVDKVEHPRRRPPNLCKNDLNRDLFSLELNGFSHHKTKDGSAQTVWHLQSYVMKWRPQFSIEQISGSLTTRNLATKTGYSKPRQTKKKKKPLAVKLQHFISLMKKTVVKSPRSQHFGMFSVLKSIISCWPLFCDCFFSSASKAAAELSHVHRPRRWGGCGEVQSQCRVRIKTTESRGDLPSGKRFKLKPSCLSVGRN